MFIIHFFIFFFTVKKNNIILYFHFITVQLKKTHILIQLKQLVCHRGHLFTLFVNTAAGGRWECCSATWSTTKRPNIKVALWLTDLLWSSLIHGLAASSESICSVCSSKRFAAMSACCDVTKRNSLLGIGWFPMGLLFVTFPNTWKRQQSITFSRRLLTRG